MATGQTLQRSKCIIQASQRINYRTFSEKIKKTNQPKVEKEKKEKKEEEEPKAQHDPKKDKQ